MWKCALVLILNVLSTTLLSGQNPAQAPVAEQRPTIRTTTREVILDVIVRDKHHHAVADLRPEEIEVYEDGVKQKINAFRNVQGTEQLQTEQALAKRSSAPAPQNPKGPGNALRELNFVSIVFAPIAPLNLQFAREAVLEFLKSGHLPNTYITVYRLDRSLQLIQPYTADNTLLVNAVDAAVKGVNTGTPLGSSAAVASALDTTVQANVANLGASPVISAQQAQAAQNALVDPIPAIMQDPLWARNAAAEDASLAVTSALVAQAKIAAGLRFAESLSNGMDAFDALRELVRAQAKLPGRKVVLYLADGLTLPMGRRDVVDSVISFANQMEVAFYTVDTKGLSVEDPMMQSFADQQIVAAESSANKASPQLGHKEDKDIDLSTSSNKQLAMEELAESTGGFAVANTNEIALPMQRVMEDIRTHYEVAYTPSSTNYDGHFRKIQVRVIRPRVTVQTRSGYFALPEINGEPLQPFEMTALHAINAHPTPEEFPYEASLLRFRPKGAEVEYEMAFDIPVSTLQIVTDPKTGKGQVRVSLVALIHKSTGEVVGKVSRNLAQEISAQESALRRDTMLYAEPIALTGGHYFIDTAVTDQVAGKTAVKHMSVFVDSGKDFGVSSLELVTRVQRVSGVRDKQDPFEIDAGRVVPTLADAMPGGKPLNLYFVVYPNSSSSAEPTVILQMFRDGREIGRETLPSAKRREDGSMPILLRLNPQPGQCDMIVTAQQGTLTSEASLSVKITPSAAENPN